MPFRNVTQFNVETLQKMREAYDAACIRLGIAAHDPLTGTLAAKIVDLADAGERDPQKLCDLAVSQMSEPKSKK